MNEEWERVSRDFVGRMEPVIVSCREAATRGSLSASQQPGTLRAKSTLPCILRIMAALCALLLVTIGARAQNTADVVGTVTDTSGGVVPGATITLTNAGTGISLSTQSSG